MAFYPVATMVLTVFLSGVLMKLQSMNTEFLLPEFFYENSQYKLLSKCLEIRNKFYPFESKYVWTISARRINTFYVSIKNIEKRKPWLYIGKEIYNGDALVKNFRGRTYKKFANKIVVWVTILIPTVTTGDLEETNFQQITR